jgi:hypothetical protein
LAIPRGDLRRASTALESVGWRRSGALPDTASLDWVPMVYFSRGGVGLWLQWRLLPAAPEHIADCERELLQHRQAAGPGMTTFSPESMFLAALCGRFEFDSDEVPWEADAALLPIDQIDWGRWTALAARFAPEAFDRLEQVRQMGLIAPRIKRPALPRPVRPSLTERIYRKSRHLAGKVLRRAKRVSRTGLRRLSSRVKKTG